jgi:hypothetical protein
VVPFHPDREMEGHYTHGIPRVSRVSTTVAGSPVQRRFGSVVF